MKITTASVLVEYHLENNMLFIESILCEFWVNTQNVNKFVPFCLQIVHFESKYTSIEIQSSEKEYGAMKYHWLIYHFHKSFNMVHCSLQFFPWKIE